MIEHAESIEHVTERRRFDNRAVGGQAGSWESDPELSARHGSVTPQSPCPLPLTFTHALNTQPSMPATSAALDTAVIVSGDPITNPPPKFSVPPDVAAQTDIVIEALKSSSTKYASLFNCLI
jgi:hypothetical protein